jgi:hypothetical protein
MGFPSSSAAKTVAFLGSIVNFRSDFEVKINDSELIVALKVI